MSELLLLYSLISSLTEEERGDMMAVYYKRLTSASFNKNTEGVENSGGKKGFLMMTSDWFVKFVELSSISSKQVRIYFLIHTEVRFLTPPLFVRSVLLGCDHSPDLPLGNIGQKAGQQEEECCEHQEGARG